MKWKRMLPYILLCRPAAALAMRQNEQMPYCSGTQTSTTHHEAGAKQATRAARELQATTFCHDRALCSLA
jgi:hypothetical protein